MDFQEAIKELNAGKKIRRRAWDNSIFLLVSPQTKNIYCYRYGIKLFDYDLELFNSDGWFIEDDNKEYTFSEAIKAIFERKKVFHKVWENGDFIFCSDNKKEIYRNQLEFFNFLPTHECLNANDWEILE